MIDIESNRAYYHHGTAEARIYRNVSIPKTQWKVRIFDLTLTFLFFGAHTMYRKRMQSTRPKGKVYKPEFQKFIQSLLAEWAGGFTHLVLVADLTPSAFQIPIYW
jgi:hypothetical protein